MHRYKYRCNDCGFTGKGGAYCCPYCKSTKYKCYGNKFRFSKKKRKNPLRKERNKTLHKIINNNPRQPRMHGGWKIININNRTGDIIREFKPYTTNYNKDPK